MEKQAGTREEVRAAAMWAVAKEAVRGEDRAEKARKAEMAEVVTEAVACIVTGDRKTTSPSDSEHYPIYSLRCN